MADRYFVFRLARVKPGTHLARNLAVQSGNRIRATREPQAQDRHAELLGVVAWMFPAQRHETIVRQTEGIPQLAQLLFNQTGIEPVVSRRNRRMSGENNL